MNGPVGRIFVRAAHREFVAVRFSKKDCARSFEARDGCRVVERSVIFEDLGAASCADAFRAQHVFDGDRNASEAR